MNLNFNISTEKESVIDDKDFEKRFQQEAKISVYEDDEESPAFVPVPTGKRLRYEILDSKKVGAKIA